MSTHHEVTQKRDLISVQRRSEIELHLESVAHRRTKDKEKLQFFSEVDGPTLRKARDQLNSKTSRLDPIPTWLLKQHWNEFEPFLVSTYNKLLRERTYPNELKVGSVCPFVKKRGLDKNKLDNWWPVSDQ